MTGTESELEVIDNKDEQQYEAWLGDRRAGLVVYDVAPGHITFLHTEIEPEFEGRGVGSRLVALALDDARARGLRVTPACPFVAGYIQRHPEYADVGDNPTGRSVSS